MTTALSRRDLIVGAAATAAAVALPAVAASSARQDWTWTGITWDGRHPSSQCAVWEDRLHALLWKCVGDQWVCLGPIVDPVYTLIDDGGAPGMETYVQAVPGWDLVAQLAEDETDTPED